MALQMYSQNEPLTQIKNIIAIAAGKGGVGKSTVAVNLALALQKMGYRIGVLDTDIYGPSLRRMLPEEKLPSQRGVIIQPADCKGIKMISMAYFRKESEASAVRAPIANSMVTQFINNVAWGKLDFLLVDFPPGTGDIQITICQQANLNGALMVTTPQEVAIMDVKKAINLFDQMKVPILGIVENMSYYSLPGTNEKHYLFGQGGGARLAKEGGISFLQSIPVDPNISNCGDAGQSIFEFDTPAAQSFADLAIALIKSLEVQENENFFKELRKIDDSNFVFIWNDGKEQQLRMSELQRNCSCANCVEEISGRRLVNPDTIYEDVQAHEIRMVGRYGLRIRFSSGCSSGIYSFDMIKKLAKI